MGEDALPQFGRANGRTTSRGVRWLIPVVVVSVIVWAAALFLPISKGPIYVALLVVFIVVVLIDALLVLAGLVLAGVLIWGGLARLLDEVISHGLIQVAMGSVAACFFGVTGGLVIGLGLGLGLHALGLVGTYSQTTDWPVVGCMIAGGIVGIAVAVRYSLADLRRDGVGVRARTVVKVAAIAILGVAAFAAFEGLVIREGARESHANLVRFYCGGAVSEAQYQGCIHHVTAADIDRLANNGDQTAIYAEDHYTDGEPDCPTC
jgi:hypothetical protein